MADSAIDDVNQDLKLTLPEAMQIVFACLKELDERIKKLEEKNENK